ncbi:AHH domain-containing protein [Vibrio sp. 10N.261.46.E11]|uniref:AHH domain-containing protein n=1 Tax=Vibrio sp. 10N.261.46.E11 TaxID=3229662 RepID=UPI00354B6935
MGYRKNILNRIKNDLSHPINHGFKMQVHHLVSKNGVIKSGKKSILEAYGYDINLAGNLVALPSTLGGACHLKVQLHRGNHTTPIEDNDNDKVHPMSYHTYVKKMLKPAVREIKTKCKTNDIQKVQAYLNLHSQVILDDISSFRLPLTRVFKAFESGAVGCLGEKEVGSLANKIKLNIPCTCDRVHSEYNSFPSIGYTLKRGR